MARLVVTFECFLESFVASDESFVESEPWRVCHDIIDAWALIGIHLKHVADQSCDVIRSLRVGKF